MTTKTKLLTRFSEYRFALCVYFACFIHAVIFFGFNEYSPAHTASHQPLLDLILIAPQSNATAIPDNREHPLLERDLATGSHYLTQVSSISKTSERKRTVSMSHHKPQDAAYLARWQAYIEEIGNHHVATEFEHKHLKGQLRLLVAVNKDGTLKEVNLTQSSGHKGLDDVAVKIVTMAAPFEPLPKPISNEVDVLEIIRTWQFNGLVIATG